jgi:hypothetical protein
MPFTDSRPCRLNGHVVWIMAIFFAVSETFSAPADKRVAVIERDTIQTRNFVPVVNHHALVANLSEQSLVVSIESPLLVGLYRKDGYLSAFGYDSLLGTPLFAPFTLPIEKEIQLPKPTLQYVLGAPRYIWNEARMEAKQAVVAQYDNYFGPASQFRRSDGLTVIHWRIIQRYDLKSAGETYDFRLNLELVNQGKEDIEEAFFRIFIPEAVALPGQNELTPIILTEDAWASESMGLARSSMSDGQGNATQGIDASQLLGVLKPGQPVPLVIRMRFHQKKTQGQIFPVLTILGRQKETRIWPATEVRGAERDEQKSFHYLFYNLVIAEDWAIFLNNKKVEIKSIDYAGR